MPAPMPPQAPPQPPDAGQSGPPPGAQGGQSGGAISSLLINVGKAMDHLNLAIGQSKGTNPQEKQLMSQLNAGYGKLLDMLGVQDQDDGDEDQAGAQGQTVPPEAAGNPGAKPVP